MSERVEGAKSTVVLALVGIILVAASLRTAVTSLPPLLDRVAEDFAVDTLTLSVIGATPSAAFAIFGLLAPRISHRWGVEPTLIFALVVMSVGYLSRGLAVNSVSLVGATVLTFAGIGIANVLLPPLIKRYFPRRIYACTALVGLIYGGSTAVAAAITPVVAGPLGWRAAIAGWAATALLAIIPWTIMVRSGRVTPAEDPDVEGSRLDKGARARLHRSPTAWAIAFLFGNGAMIVFTLIVWLPSLLHDLAGIPFAEGGAWLALFSVMSLPMNLAIIVVGSRPRFEPVYVALGILCFTIGLSGLLFAPGAAPILWLILLGLGPMAQQVGIIMIGTRTRTHEATVALSGFSQSIGYTMGALGPLMFGGLHALTGSWTLSLAVFLGSLVMPLAALLVVRRQRFVEDEWLPNA